MNTSPYPTASFDYGLLKVLRQPEVWQSFQSLIALPKLSGASMLSKALPEFLAFASEEEANMAQGQLSSLTAQDVLEQLRVRIFVGFLRMWGDLGVRISPFGAAVAALPAPAFNHVQPWAVAAYAALPGTELNRALTALAKAHPEAVKHPLMPNSRAVVTGEGFPAPEKLPLDVTLDSPDWNARQRVLFLKVTLSVNGELDHVLQRYLRLRATPFAKMGEGESAPSFRDDCLVLHSLVDALTRLADEAALVD